MASKRGGVPTFEDIQKELEKLQDKLGENVKFSLFQQRANADSEEASPKEGNKFKFNLRPKEIKAYLDRYVIKQDDAKKALAIAICDHYNRVIACQENPAIADEEYTKQNIILVGPTGVGKTYLIRTIAKLVGVPFVKADATKFSETGYVGGNVEDLIRDLVAQADGDLEAASYGIVYLDEIDKIATSPNIMGRDVSGRGVQMGLLKLMEETDVDIRGSNDLQSQIQSLMDASRSRGKGRHVVNTKHIQFIVSGAFNGLQEIVKKRLRSTAMGFGADIRGREDAEDLLPYVASQDFIAFGFEPEFIGRLPVHVSCKSLSSEDLFQILKYSEGSIIRQYQQSFRAYGIDARFTDDGLRRLAERAHQENTGARGLMTVCERTLRDFKYELSDVPVKALSVDAALVADPSAALAFVLEHRSAHLTQAHLEDLQGYPTVFEKRHSLRLRVEDEAASEIVSQAIEEGCHPYQILDLLFERYQLCLDLIRRNAPNFQLELTAQGYQNPDRAVDAWIRASYALSRPVSDEEGAATSASPAQSAPVPTDQAQAPHAETAPGAS